MGMKQKKNPKWKGRTKQLTLGLDFIKNILSFYKFSFRQRNWKKKLSNFNSWMIKLTKTPILTNHQVPYGYFLITVNCIIQLLSFFVSVSLFKNLTNSFSSNNFKHCDGYSALLSNEKFFKACHFLLYAFAV